MPTRLATTTSKPSVNITTFATSSWCSGGANLSTLRRYRPRRALRSPKIRHQRLMISKLELSEGMTVVDVGCGIGGPMRRVVREGGVKVVGVNKSEVQLEKAKSLNREAGLDHMVDYLACSFMDMGTVEDDTFDRGYAIESTCHAPDKAGAFAEIYRVMKPGALFWGQEMCMTDKFNPEGQQAHKPSKGSLCMASRSRI